MKTITISSSEKTVDIQSPAFETQTVHLSSMRPTSISQPSFGAVVGAYMNTSTVVGASTSAVVGAAGTSTVVGASTSVVVGAFMTSQLPAIVLIETRPVAFEKGMKTQRLNHAVQLGYFPPLKETISKLK